MLKSLYLLLAYIDNENEKTFYVKGHNDNINQNNLLWKLVQIFQKHLHN